MYISSIMLFSASLSYFCIFWHEKKCLIKSVWVIAFAVLSVSNFNYSNSHLYMVYIYLVENKINGLRLNFISFSCSVDAKKNLPPIDIIFYYILQLLKFVIPKSFWYKIITANTAYIFFDLVACYITIYELSQDPIHMNLFRKSFVQSK